MSNLVNNFYQQKTVQRAYNFVVEFERTTDTIADKFVNTPLDIFNETGEHFPIKPWHVKNVDIPGITAKSEQQKIGPFAINYPMLELDNPILKIAFEEDEDGTVAKFIHWLAKRRINASGFYYDLSQSNIGTIVVKIFKPKLDSCITYRFYECVFMSSTGLNLAYDSSEATAYDVEFSFKYSTITDTSSSETFN